MNLEPFLLAGKLPDGTVDVVKVFEEVLLIIEKDDLTISDRACILVESIICTSELHRSLLVAMFRESLKFAQSDKNIYLRFANIWARVIGKSEILFESCMSCGAVDAILSMCRSNQDILVQIVSIELLTEFAKTSLGLKCLFDSGTVVWLVSVPSREEDASLLGNQALRQLGDIFVTASSKSHMTEEFWATIDKGLIVSYLQTVCSYLDSRSESDRLTGEIPNRIYYDFVDFFLSSFRIMSLTILGLYALSSFSSSCGGALHTVMANQPLIDSLFDLLNCGKVEIVTAALFAVARVIEMETHHSRLAGTVLPVAAAENSEGAGESKSSGVALPLSSDIVGLKKHFVSEMGRAKGVAPVIYLIKTARQPVIERKLAVYAVLTALCQQQPAGWGLQALFARGTGFEEFLADRNTEHTKEGKDAKFR